MLSVPDAVLRLLLDLENRRVRASMDWDTQHLVLEPASLITESEREFIATNYKAVLTAVAIATDAGVHARRKAFEGRTGSNRLVPDAPYRSGSCWSCGTDSLPTVCGRPTRCWRCALGWSLAFTAQP